VFSGLDLVLNSEVDFGEAEFPQPGAVKE